MAPAITGFTPFNQSFIERYGDKMYVASDNYLGELVNIDNPGSSGGNLVFNSTFRNLGFTSPNFYGNGAGSSSPHQFRYILPEQIDMSYTPLNELSCACCQAFNGAVEEFSVTNTSTETSSPGTPNNPFSSASGDVFIHDRLRIIAGSRVVISNMNFYFGQGATVVIERGTPTKSGGYLRLTDGTVFTADNRCTETSIVNCGIPDNCSTVFWQGVRVQGDNALQASRLVPQA